MKALKALFIFAVNVYFAYIMLSALLYFISL